MYERNPFGEHPFLTSAALEGLQKNHEFERGFDAQQFFGAKQDPFKSIDTPFPKTLSDIMGAETDKYLIPILLAVYGTKFAIQASEKLSAGKNLIKGYLDKWLARDKGNTPFEEDALFTKTNFGYEPPTHLNGKTTIDTESTAKPSSLDETIENSYKINFTNFKNQQEIRDRSIKLMSRLALTLQKIAKKDRLPSFLDTINEAGLESMCDYYHNLKSPDNALKAGDWAEKKLAELKTLMAQHGIDNPINFSNLTETLQQNTADAVQEKLPEKNENLGSFEPFDDETK